MSYFFSSIKHKRRSERKSHIFEELAIATTNIVSVELREALRLWIFFMTRWEINTLYSLFIMKNNAEPWKVDFFFTQWVRYILFYFEVCSLQNMKNNSWRKVIQPLASSTMCHIHYSFSFPFLSTNYSQPSHLSIVYWIFDVVIHGDYRFVKDYTTIPISLVVR